MEKETIIEQTKLAFSLIQTLYYETALFIQEIEGMLAEEDERFVIGKPAGYAISARRSTGLERINVPFWMMKKLAVFFVPEERTKNESGGMTNTKISSDLKIIFIRIILDDKDIREPKIYSGVFSNFVIKNDKKFEYFMAILDAKDSFIKDGEISYEDSNLKFNGKFFSTHLYDLKDSEQISTRIIKPLLKIYRSIG
jgi:hypothetical protein